MKSGALYKHKISGGIFIQDGEAFRKRFIDKNDWELIEHGMGHLAGSYGLAVKLISSDRGTTRTWSVKNLLENFVKICES